MVTASVSLSVCRAPAKTAERIDNPFGVETFGHQGAFYQMVFPSPRGEGMVRCGLCHLLSVWLCRKKTTLVSQVFTLLGAACSAVCVAASAPELLMIGRVLVGVNSGLFRSVSLHALRCAARCVPHCAVRDSNLFSHWHSLVYVENREVLS